MLDPLRLYEYRCAVHVHSSYSDGTEMPERIIADAKRAGLDVLWLTDHDTRQAVVTPGCGYYGHLLFLVGAEITPPTNHYLAFGSIALPSADRPLQQVIDQVREQKGVGFIAHPNDLGNATARLPSYRWTDRHVDGFTGFEVWNHLSDWSRQIHNMSQGIWAALKPFSGLKTIPQDTLNLWDQWGQMRPVVGIGGTDVHAAHVGVWPFSLTVFPYRVAFGAIRTHVYLREPLSTDWRVAEGQLVEALGLGRVAVVNAHWGTEVGFRYWIENENGQAYSMGTELEYSERSVLRGLSPVPVVWNLYRDGMHAVSYQGTLMHHVPNGPGVWRVELSRSRRGERWIYSNPIYIR